MMRWLFLLIALWSVEARSQTSQVFDGELELAVTVAETGATPFVGELVMVTIEGTYRRHITREKLLPVTINEFSWSQLGEDIWFDRVENGKKVKAFRRRMALFPDRAGRLEIPSFTHRLTLLDEANKWFEHDISSPPISVEVLPKPDFDGWWLPVRSLRISDVWSNAPDQLGEGEGVLRVIRVEAAGVSPDFLPPMPELTSPSAMIFRHPEQRLVELSPEGPVAIAFWRWTIRPKNQPSAILEPLHLDYFDTVNRVARRATISPQRIAYAETVLEPVGLVPPEGRDRSSLALAITALAILLGCGGLLLMRRGLNGTELLRRMGFEPNRKRLAKAVRAGDVGSARDAARAIFQQTGREAVAEHIADLDQNVFGPNPRPPDLRKFRRDVLG